MNDARNGRIRELGIAALMGVALSALAGMPAYAQGRGEPLDTRPPDTRPPDPCAPVPEAAEPAFTYHGPVSVPGWGSIRVYLPALAGPVPARRSDHVVLILDGNGFDWSEYQDLAGYLAGEGFIAAIAERPALTVDPEFVIDALDSLFHELALPSGTPVGLVGHSRGATAAVDAAIANRNQARGYDIRALASVAPHILDAGHLTVDDALAYLVIYGAQDEDTHGTNGIPREGFAAFDKSGTESSTTCTAQFCLPTEAMDRTMIYIHGADHEGLFGLDSHALYGPASIGNEFIAAADQHCITKAYTMGFMDWKLRDSPTYEPMLRDWDRPASIESMTSYQADYLGNPAGTALRMYFQISPPERIALESFEFGGYDLVAQTPGIELEEYRYTDLVAGALPAAAPHYVRHLTDLLRVSWSSAGGMEMAVFDLPAAVADSTHFTHMAIRIAQLWGMAPPYDNAVNGIQVLSLGLGQGSDLAWQPLTVPRNDLRAGFISAHTGMSTVTIELDEFDALDRRNVRRFALAFPAGTQGSVVIDNLEWHRY